MRPAFHAVWAFAKTTGSTAAGVIVWVGFGKQLNNQSTNLDLIPISQFTAFPFASNFNGEQARSGVGGERFGLKEIISLVLKN
jgi:hypothetical protein